MKIVIVGCGNVGRALADTLSKEGHDISIIDSREEIVNDTSNEYDVLGVIGNGTSIAVQVQAGVKEADVLIAVTGNDEINLLCCLIGKRAGVVHTIARVSDPNYSDEAAFIKSGLGLSMIVNPQLAVAREIVKLLKFPSAEQIEVFPRSKVEIVVYKINNESTLVGLSPREMSNTYGKNFIVTAIERDGETFIPHGDFEFKVNDYIHIMGQPSDLVKLFGKLGITTTTVKRAMVVGGGRTTIYMVKSLLEMGIHVTIIDKNRESCERMSGLFPKAMVICGDCTDHDLLIEEGIENMDAFITLTNIDEVNIMLSLYVNTVSKAKLVTRLHRTGYEQIIKSLAIGSPMFPRFIATENILKFIRGLEKSADNEMETLYKITESGAEALEFRITKESAIVGKPLRELHLKKDMLIASITHEGITEIPRGDSVINVGDMVVLVTTENGIRSITDALL